MTTNPIYFIDSRVADYQRLIAALPVGSKAFLLSPDQDGIEQMQAILSDYQDLDSIQIISHGVQGTLYLGNTVLDQNNLGSYQHQIGRIGSSLSGSGDLLLYGCNVAQGEQGQSFIEQLAQLTGADVAASEDLTGNAVLGGDWTLEKKTGAIETAAQFFNYQHLLSPVVPVGTEILVNTATQGDQYYSQVATLANGGFVISWEDHSVGTGGATGDRSQSAIKAQIFNDDGSKNGDEFLVNTATNSWQIEPKILALQNGGFVINWTDNSNGVGGAAGDSDGTAVKAQIFDSSGERIGNEILVNTTTTNRQDQYLSDYSSDNSISLPNGNFIIVWNDWSDTTRVKAQLFNPTGNKIGSEIDVSTYGEYNFDIAVLKDGKFVITSIDQSTTSIDGSDMAVGARIFNPDGSKYNDEILVNTATYSSQVNPEIAALQNGGFVITWEDNSQGVGGATGDTSGTAIKAQVFNSDGSKFDNEILVNTTTENSQELTQIAALPNGGFVIAWHDWSNDHEVFKVKAQVFSPEGNKIGDEILVNTVTGNQQWGPRIIALPNSDFVIFWQKEAAYDFSQSEAKGQLFSAIGNKIGDEFPVIDILTEEDFYRGSKITLINDIAVLSDGKIIVSLSDNNPAGGGATAIDDASGSAVKAQIFQVLGAITNHSPTGSVYINDITPELGQTLTASNDLADADGLGMITYRWYTGDTLIGTGDTFMVTTYEIGKTISITASYTDGSGNVESVRSAATAVVSDGSADSVIDSGDLRLVFLSDAQRWIKLPDSDTWIATGDMIVGLAGRGKDLLRLEGGDYAITRDAFYATGVTVYSIAGGTEKALFSGNFDLSLNKPAGAINATDNILDLGGVDFKYTSLELIFDTIRLGNEFTLPADFSETIPIKITDVPVVIDETRIALSQLSSTFFSLSAFKLLNYINIEPTFLEITYDQMKDKLLIGGELNISEEGFFPKKVDTAIKGNIAIQNGAVSDLLVSLEVKKILGFNGYGIKDLILSIDTAKNEIKSGLTVLLPFTNPYNRADSELFKTYVSFEDYYRYSSSPPFEDWAIGALADFQISPFKLDGIRGSFSGGAIPLGETSLLVTGFSGEMHNFAPTNPEPWTVRGSITIEHVLDNFLKFDITGELNFESITGSVDGNFLGEGKVDFSAEADIDWKEESAELKDAHVSFFNNLLNAEIDIKTDTGFNTIKARGSAKFNPLDIGISISGNAYLNIENNDNESDDYVKVWGESLISFPGFDKMLVKGVKVSLHDGDWELFGAKDVPIYSSWIVDSSMSDLIVTVDWQNEAVNPVHTRVVVYDDLAKTKVREIINESDYLTHGIAVVDEWSGLKNKVIYISEPEAGLWDVEVVDPDGLGDINYSATTSLAENTFDFGAASASGNLIQIGYNLDNLMAGTRLTVFADTDGDGYDGTLIGAMTINATSGLFTWNSSGFSAGQYWLYGVLEDDERIPLFDYANNPIDVVAQLMGTLNDDVLIGTPGDDITMFGLAGNDTLEGRNGDDALNGGEGKDILVGGNGVDILTGGAGKDSFKDNVAGLIGDTITDFSESDVIHIDGVRLVDESDVHYDPVSGLLALDFQEGNSIFINLPIGLDPALIYSRVSSSEDKPWTEIFGPSTENNAPELTGTVMALTDGTEDTNYIVNASALLTGWTDVEGDLLNITSLTADHGIAIDNLDGTYTIVPEANYNGAMTLKYGVSDGADTTATTLAFVLAPVDDTPRPGDDYGAVNEDSSVTVSFDDLMTNDIDVDGASKTIIGIDTTGTAGSVVIDVVNRTMTYSADADAFDLLATGAIAKDSFKYTLQGSSGETNTATVFMDVIGVNDETEISGTIRSETLNGTAGDDRIRGNDGNDVLKGGAGNDWLAGERGSDILLGGLGKDVFFFSKGGGGDTISDFTNGFDKIQIAADTGITSFDQLKIAGGGGKGFVYTTFGLGNDTQVVLNGVPSTVLDATDFIFTA